MTYYFDSNNGAWFVTDMSTGKEKFRLVGTNILFPPVRSGLTEREPTEVVLESDVIPEYEIGKQLFVWFRGKWYEGTIDSIAKNPGYYMVNIPALRMKPTLVTVERRAKNFIEEGTDKHARFVVEILLLP